METPPGRQILGRPLKLQVARLLDAGLPYRKIAVEVGRTAKRIRLMESLEMAIYALRQRYSSMGLFPSFWLLNEAVNAWVEEDFGEPFVWQSELNDAVWVNRWDSVWQYYAVRGWAFELRPGAWDRFGHREEVSTGRLEVRPRIRIEHLDPAGQTVELEVVPLLEFAYHLTLKTNLPPDRDGADIDAVKAVKVLEKAYRECLRVTPAASKFVFNTGALDDRLRPSVILPPEFFELLDEKFAGEGVKLTLLPRHLVNVPARGRPRLWALQVANIRKRCGEEYCGLNRGKLTLISASILQAIEEATRNGTYHANIVKAIEWQEERRDYPRLQDPAGWRAVFLKFINDESASTGLPPILELLAAPPAGASFLKNFDADFLQSGFSLAARNKVSQVAQCWQTLVEQKIQKTIWDGNRFSFQKASRLSPIKDEARVGDLEEHCLAARDEFLGHEVVVIRRAIENAQRLCIAGHPPVPFVVERESDLHSRWTSFLRRRLRRIFSIEKRELR